MEDVVLMVGPVFFRQLYGDLLQLVQKAVRAGDLEAALQRRRHRVLMFLPVLPEVRSCIHKRLSTVWKWEILTIASAEEREIS